MSHDDIINKLWEDSNHGTMHEDIEAAFDAGAATEREECAKVCESKIELLSDAAIVGDIQRAVGENCCINLAAAIRARSKP